MNGARANLETAVSAWCGARLALEAIRPQDGGEDEYLDALEAARQKVERAAAIVVLRAEKFIAANPQSK